MNLGSNVLIIDDDGTLRRTLTRILQTADCEVSSACTGQEGLRLLSANPYNLVYLDIRLPDINGLEVLREIRKSFPQLPVVVFTGHGTLQSAMEALRLGRRITC